MPKSLKELSSGKVGIKRAGGQKIKFAPIVKRIIASGQYYTVSEVWKSPQMVNKVVSRFRTMKLLNKQVAGRRLMKIFDNGRFHYGKFDADFAKAHGVK